MPQSGQLTLPGLSLQSLVAHRVPLKPYAAPVPRSQSLQDQPTRNLAAFPASQEPDPAVTTPTATPSARGAVIRQNSDPTSEGPGPSPNPPAWVRPDPEAPPKVRAVLWDQERAKEQKEEELWGTGKVESVQGWKGREGPATCPGPWASGTGGLAGCLLWDCVPAPGAEGENGSMPRVFGEPWGQTGWAAVPAS